MVALPGGGLSRSCRSVATGLGRFRGMFDREHRCGTIEDGSLLRSSRFGLARVGLGVDVEIGENVDGTVLDQGRLQADFIAQRHITQTWPREIVTNANTAGVSDRFGCHATVKEGTVAIALH